MRCVVWYGVVLYLQITLHTSDDIMHMCIECMFASHTLYTAEECGKITRVDTRSRVGECVYYNVRKDGVGSVKALCQSESLGSYGLVFGGSGLDICLLDLRMNRSKAANGVTQDNSKSIVRTWGPQYLAERLGCVERGLSKSKCAQNTAARDTIAGPPVFTSAISNIALNRLSARESYWPQPSISGLQISSNGRSMLASYQGDNIYMFDLFSKSEKDIVSAVAAYSKPRSLLTEECGGPVHNVVYSDEATLVTDAAGQADLDAACCWNHSAFAESRGRVEAVGAVGAHSMFTGHVNNDTFLKSVSFYGPHDEYVVAGSDNGLVYIWDTKSGAISAGVSDFDAAQQDYWGIAVSRVLLTALFIYTISCRRY